MTHVYVYNSQVQFFFRLKQNLKCKFFLLSMFYKSAQSGDKLHYIDGKANSKLEFEDLKRR